MDGKQLHEFLLAHGITPESIDYKGEKRIKLTFGFNSRLIQAVKQVPGRLWSRTLKAWHISRDMALLEELVRKLGGDHQNDSGVATPSFKYRQEGALRHDAMDVDTTTGNIGLRIDIRRKQAWGEFSPQLRVEYQHDFQGNGVATMDYTDLPGSSSYRTPLSDFDRRRIMLGVGAAFRIDSGLRTRIEYRGLLGNGGDRDHGLQFSLEKSY